MPILMPYDHDAWVSNSERINNAAPGEIKELLDRICPGKRWGKVTADLLASRDDSHARRLLFVKLAAPQSYFEQGQLSWCTYTTEMSPESSEEHADYDADEEVPIDRTKLLEASAQLLPMALHQKMDEWLSKSAFGKGAEKVYLLSADAVQAILAILAADAQLSDRIEPLSAPAFEKHQEYEIHPWQHIVDLVLGYVRHYGMQASVGIAFSETEFRLPQKQNGGDHSAFNGYLDAGDQFAGMKYYRRYLFERPNAPGRYFFGETEDSYAIEPRDAVIAFYEARRGTLPHWAFVDTQGRNFHFEPSKPSFLQWLLGRPSLHELDYALSVGKCRRAGCGICAGAEALAGRMVGGGR